MNWNIFKKGKGGKFKIKGKDKTQLHFHPNFAWRTFVLVSVILLVGGLAGLYYLFSATQKEVVGEGGQSAARIENISREDITKLSNYLDLRAENLKKYQSQKPLLPDPSVAPK